MHFRNIHTFTYQKHLLYTLFLLVSKIVESLQCLQFFHLNIFFFFAFCVSLHKEQLEPTFSACLIDLANLREVFECSVIIDFISTMFELSVWLIRNYF